MYRYIKLKTVMIMLLTVLSTFLFFAPAANAKGTTSTTNKPPVISQGETTSLTVNGGGTASLTLNATDSNKDTMTWNVSTQGAIGTASVGSTTNQRGTSTAAVTYVPSSSGTDSFVITVNDGKGGSDSITISATITPAPVTRTINYVALGDSIATGTIYPGKSITPYVNYFYDFLITQNPSAKVALKSFATDGDRTNELYAKLGLDGSSGNSELITAVQGANIITISIGGNNLMRAARDESALGGYNFNYIDTAIADQGLADFNLQFLPIMQKIRTLSPNAQIIVNSIYNPYNETDAALHNTVDSYLFRTDSTGINDIISSNTALGYNIADVYKAFNDGYRNDMGAVTYFYADPWDLMGMLTRNPHPNAAGQNIILNLIKGAYRAIPQV